MTAIFDSISVRIVEEMSYIKSVVLETMSIVVTVKHEVITSNSPREKISIRAIFCTCPASLSGKSPLMRD